MLRSELLRLFGPTPLPLWLRAILFAAVYYLCAVVGNFLTPATAGRTYVIFWLPAGLYVAVLLLHAPRQWGWFIAAALPANLAFDLTKGTPLYLIIAFYASNTVQATLGAWLVQTFVSPQTRLRNVKEFFGFIALAGIFSTVFGALIGAGALHAAGLNGDFLQAVKTWWGSCAMAVLLFSPVVITWCDPADRPSSSPEQKRWRIIEGIALYGGLIVGTWMIFVMSPGINTPYKFRTLPFLVWAGLRFGRRGAATANLLYAALVVYSASHAQELPAASDLTISEVTFTIQTYLVVAALVGLVPAITLAERNNALVKLRESETHYRNLTEAAFEGVCISEDGRLLDVSDQLLAMVGYERQEVLGRQTSEFIAPESREAVAEAIRSKSEAPYLVKLLRKDGRILHCEVRAKVVQTGGRSLRMTALRDLTERLGAEAALRENQRMLATLMANLPGLVYRCQNDKDWTMLFVSEGAYMLTGYRPQDLLANRTLSFASMIHPDDQTRAQQTVQTALQRRGVFELNYRIRTASGDEKWVWERGQGVFGPDGNLIALEGFITDITAQRNAEAEREAATQRVQEIHAEFTRQLIASQEAERTRIAREIHDHLGQLLTALKLDLRSLERRTAGINDSELQAALLGKISSARELANETITSVQKIASELRPGILDRLGLAAAIEAEAQTFAARSGVTCKCSVPDETPALPQDLAIAAFRIFQEIMTNVARHAQATVVEIELRLDATRLELEVTDNGIGLDEKHFANPKSFGLLGMTERAEILGGRIEFRKHPAGSGTVVAVQLPLSETKLPN
jgi:two-component system sensor histidine kinase UhpB